MAENTEKERDAVDDILNEILRNNKPEEQAPTLSESLADEAEAAPYAEEEITAEDVDDADDAASDADEDANDVDDDDDEEDYDEMRRRKAKERAARFTGEKAQKTA